jgi:hypothetical protein
MPIHSVPNTDLEYALISFDKNGNERREPSGSLLSEVAVERLRDAARGITDVFVMSHGWKGDIPAAVSQYNAWSAAMAACDADRTRVRQRWPGFTALLIGFHWPSQPWGDENMAGSFGTTTGAGEAAFVRQWADHIADTPAARDALRVLYEAAQQDIEPDRLPGPVVDAYRVLEREAGIGADGVAGAPDADREPLDPQLAYEDWQDFEAASFGDGFVGGLLSPLRQLSFWTMKKRARHVGERGGHQLIRSIVAARGTAATSNRLRVHLMGHSFGCIVVSSMLRGADARGVRISSMLLVQGAMSLWSYANDLPGKPGSPGYFRPVIDAECVAGPIVVTTSSHDSAVGKLYPVAAGAARQVEYEPSRHALPTYGAIGSFGVQGPGLSLEKRQIARDDVTRAYDFAPGRIYNLAGDDVIRTGGGLSGAHSDIAHPEVGHAFWEAVLATPDD